MQSNLSAQSEDRAQAPIPSEKVDLERFANPEFARGRTRIIEALWLIVQWLLVSSWLPGAWHRRVLLRLFGARIGKGVDIKPRVRVKFPWRLQIGDFSWIGEDVWIDNLAPVAIGDNCCISQGAYICTGSHDWRSPTFDLIVRPVLIECGAWIAARAVIAPGVTVREGAVLTLGSCAQSDLARWGVYSGCPAKLVRQRRLDLPGVRSEKA